MIETFDGPSIIRNFLRKLQRNYLITSRSTRDVSAT